MWIFLNAKRPKLIPVMGQLGISTGLNCHWGLGCLMGTFNHLISNGLVWSMGSCFCPSLGAFTSLTHTMQVYQLRFGHPVWRSLVTAVRILPNIGPPASKKNFPGCKYTWGKFWTADPQNLVAGAGPSQSFGHVGGSPLLQDKFNVTWPWSARGLSSL